MHKLSLLISFLFILTNFSSAQISRQEYIDTYKELAIKEMNRTGIPASITLSQGILESGNGNSRLAKQANNHFGIKCHSSWKGKTIRKDDDKKDECFRKYKSVYASFKDHSDFLTKGKRYAFLFDYKSTAYKKWAKGLKKAGYATSSTYASRLIKIIEESELHQYDSGELLAVKKAADPVEKAKPTARTYSTKKNKKPHLSKEEYAIRLGRVIETNNRVKFIVAKKGDSYSKLIEEFQLLRFELYRYNDAEKGDQLNKGDVVYLQPKRCNAEKGKKYHTVTKDETVRTISQKYGIKLKKILKRNQIQKGEQLKLGAKIQISK